MPAINEALASCSTPLKFAAGESVVAQPAVNQPLIDGCRQYWAAPADGRWQGMSMLVQYDDINWNK